MGLPSLAGLLTGSQDNKGLEKAKVRDAGFCLGTLVQNENNTVVLLASAMLFSPVKN